MRCLGVISVETAMLVCAACTVGGGDSGGLDDPPPAIERQGIVTSPRHGAARGTGELAVDGFYSFAGASVVVERWDAASGAWMALGTATTSSTGERDGAAVLYPFHVPVAVRSLWPAGGLLSLRARVDDVTLASLDAAAERQPCIEEQATWRDRIARCATGLSSITLVDTRVEPPALGHRFLDAKGASTPAETQAYYQAIAAPTTLTEFLTRYGLDDPATPTLTYYNLGDLATGREIRCKPHDSPGGTGVACTTFNYGIFGSELQDALSLAVEGRRTGTGTGSFANVSMVYDPPITAPNAVKFMVYSAAGTLLTEAQLDTLGDNASIPNNCINCHGSDGSYDPVTHSVTGARFLPFDPSAFVFSDRRGMTRGAQETAMRALNQTFLAAAPSAAHAETVKTWYGDAATLAGTADTEAVPAAWADNAWDAALYRAVIATSCRGCHASRSDDLAFATPEQFRARSGQIVRAICGVPDDPTRAMPSAEASLARFWSGPARAYLAGYFGPEMVGACTPPAP